MPNARSGRLLHRLLAPQRLTRKAQRRTRQVVQPWSLVEPLEPRVLLSAAFELPALPPGITTTASTVQTTLPSTGIGLDADLGMTPQDAQSGPLMGLDQFRSDSRFAGVDGRGFSAVILDTGIDLNHAFFGPDADGNGIADRIVFSWDFADNDANAGDYHGHGSNVSSIIGSQDATHTGVAPGVNLIHLKVFSDNGSGMFSYVERALQWVAANVDLYNIASVNMSLGDSQNWSSAGAHYGLGDELAALAAQDVIVASSAGNDFYTFNGMQGVSYPAADPNSLAVSAVYDGNVGGYSYASGAKAYASGADVITPFSQRHSTLTDVFAPGAPITGANRSGGTTTMHGTSQAAPHVAGAAVLAQQLAVRELGRRLSFDEVRDLLRDTAVTIVDGDDENDNVSNTGLSFARLDMMALGEAIIALGGATGTDPEMPNQAPVVQSLSLMPDPVQHQGELTLQATGVSDPDGQVIRVQFFHDTNGDGLAQSDEWLGEDADGNDGWTFSTTASWEAGDHTYLAVAIDNEGQAGDAASVTGEILASNTAPTIDSLTFSPGLILPGDLLTLTANGVSDADGDPVSVSFFRDINGDGVADAEELLGTDANSSDGFTLDVTVDWALGQHTYLAVATDSLDAQGETASVVGTVTDNTPPTIGSLSLQPNTVKVGDTLTLTADNVTDTEGQVLRVAFFRDVNGDGIAQTSELLGEDTNATGGWAVSLSVDWEPGRHTYLAVATDDRGAQSEPASASGRVNRAPRAGSLATSSQRVMPDESVTLTAQEVTDPDGEVAAVHFFRDANGDGIAQPDELIGSDTDPSDGLSLTRAATWGAGRHTFLALAEDDLGELSQVVTGSVVVLDVFTFPSTARQVTFTEADGDVALLTAYRGTYTIAFEGRITRTTGLSRVQIEGEDLRIVRIDAVTDSPGALLRVSIHPGFSQGDGSIEVGDLTVQGQGLRLLDLRDTRIAGDVAIDGNVYVGLFGDFDGGRFEITNSDVSPLLRFDEVTDLTLISNAGLRNLTVNDWQTSEQGQSLIRAPWATVILSCGDLAADMTFTQASAPFSLRVVRALGTLGPGTLSAAAPVGTIMAGDIDGLEVEAPSVLVMLSQGNILNAGLDLTDAQAPSSLRVLVARQAMRDVTLNAAAPVGVMVAEDVERLNLDAPSMHVLLSRSSLTDSHLSLTDGQAVNSVALVRAQEVMRNTTIEARSNLSTVMAGAFDGARIFAGVSPQAQQAPTLPNQAQALGNKTIGRVLATGLAGRQTPEFVNSQVAAWRIGVASLQRVDFDNGGIESGLAATQLGPVLFHELASGRTHRLGGDMSFQRQDFRLVPVNDAGVREPV